MKALDYIPGPLGALALLISIGGSPFSWDKSQAGLQGLTGLGWTSIALGALALFSSLFLTWRRHGELDTAARQRRKLRSIADGEVRLAIKQVTWPFFTLFGDDTEDAQLELVPNHIEDADRLAAVVKVDIRSKDRAFPGGTFDVPWAEILKDNADRGIARIDRALQIYAAYLDPGVIESLSDLRSSEFLVLRLGRLDEYVEMNTDVQFISFPFPGAKGGESGYGSFWNIVRVLDELLAKDPDRLTRRL